MSKTKKAIKPNRKCINCGKNITKAKNDHTIHMASGAICYEAEALNSINGHALGRESPLIRIDSGSSRSVCGRQWAEWWFGTPKLVLIPIQKHFRFGAAPDLQSLGTSAILIYAQPSNTDKNIPIVLPTQVDVVNSNVPMLISHESLKRTKCSIDFPTCTLLIPSVSKIRLANTRSGHLMIQGGRPSKKLNGELPRKITQFMSWESNCMFGPCRKKKKLKRFTRSCGIAREICCNESTPRPWHVGLPNTTGKLLRRPSYPHALIASGEK